MNASPSVIIIGGGPAGLFAAERLALKGFKVDLYERNPSPGRKLLVAGKSGLNLTKDEPLEQFMDHYGKYKDQLRNALESFTPLDIRKWADTHRVETFVGSSGKVFPTDMKAATLLKNWRDDLQALGVSLRAGMKWVAIDPNDHELTFEDHQGHQKIQYDVVLFALGGGSWSITGSTGEWTEIFERIGIQVSPLRPSNMGFEIAWSDHLLERFEGVPIKTVSIHIAVQDLIQPSKIGEFVITKYGVEGNLIYSISSILRDEIERTGEARIFLDLLPHISLSTLLQKILSFPTKRSLSSNLARVLSLPKEKIALLWEVDRKLNELTPEGLSNLIKGVPFVLTRSRPLNEAISSAGGIQLSELDEYFMSRKYPGIFFAGEMLDWEAPTGGYLLTATMATANWAAEGMTNFLKAGQ